jgi:hypothetical protein
MKCVASLFAAVTVCLVSAVDLQASESRAGISDQRYHAGKYISGEAGSLVVLSNCPREYRDIYRGSLYCRKPAYEVLAHRDRACPKNVWGMYRGSLYCFGRR